MGLWAGKEDMDMSHIVLIHGAQWAQCYENYENYENYESCESYRVVTIIRTVA